MSHKPGGLGPESLRRMATLVCAVISMWLLKMKKKDFVVAGEEAEGRKEGTTDCEKHSQRDKAWGNAGCDLDLWILSAAVPLTKR